MKTVNLIFLYALLFWGIMLFGSQENIGKTIQNIQTKEVQVRVFLENQPVKGLNIEDFILQEEKNPLPIAHLSTLKRTIGINYSTSNPPRCFVLIFDIIEYNSQFQEGLLYVFEHLLVPSDQLLIVINNQTLFFSDISQSAKIRLEIEKFLELQSKQAKQRMLMELASIEKQIDLIRTRSSRETERNGQGAVHLHYYMKYIKFSLEQYISALKSYKQKYLAMEPDRYYYFLKPLESLNREKYIIRFLQMPIIPKLTGKNRTMLKKLIGDLADSTWGDELYYSELFTKMLSEIDDLFNSVAEFQVETMTRLFIHMNAAFNSLLLVNTIDGGKDHMHHRLLSDIENRLIGIAQASGGISVSVKPESEKKQKCMELALNQISKFEDICYTLTYSSIISSKTEKIHVESVNKNYHVYFNIAGDTNSTGNLFRKEQEENSSELNFKGMSFKNKNFSFTLEGFLLQKKEKDEIGQVAVRIYIVDTQNNKILFDQTKLLQPKKKLIQISLNFPWLANGSVEVGVGAFDLLSGKRVINSISSRIL